MFSHFKRFEGWSDPNLVEAHIDPQGLYSGPGIGQVNVFQMIAHGCTKSHYQHVEEIQRWLVNHNWGKTILTK